MSNLETIQQIYMAFGSGNIPAILDFMADDVDWEYGSTSDVPWLQQRHGKEGVGAFFEALGSGFAITKFIPHTVLSKGDVVVVLVDIEATAKNTGIKVKEDDETHIWRFNSRGKVVKFAHKVDTHAHWLAFHGEK